MGDTTDTSSYQLYKDVPSPIDLASKLTALQGQANQNRLFQQEYNSKLGLSQIYKDAFDPATGQLDPTKIPGLIAGPTGNNITLGLPQAIQNSQEAQQRNIGIQSSQMDLAQKGLENTLGYATQLLKKTKLIDDPATGQKKEVPDVTSHDVAVALGQAMSIGHVNPVIAGQIYAELPRDSRDPTGNTIDESQVVPWLQQKLFQMQDHQQRFSALNAAPTMQQLPGGAIAPFRMPQVGPVQQAGPTIGAAVAPTTQVFDENGQARYVGATNSNNPYAPNGVPVQPQGQLQGGVPGQGAQPAPSAPSPVAQNTAAPGGNIAGQLAGPPPGVTEAATTDANANTQLGLHLQQRADQVPQTKAILGNLEGELDSINTGPGTEHVAQFKKFLNSQLGIASPISDAETAKLGAREQFNKLSGMLAQSQFQALGGTGTDAKLDATTLTSPNSELSKLGNKGIIAMLKGNEDAISAKNQAWQMFKQNNGPQSYGKFTTTFNKMYDPRVFQSQYLTPEDNKKMLSGMTKTEQKQFLNSYRTAINLGWVKLPGAQ